MLAASEDCTVIAVSLPTRSYAAVLAACGITYSAFRPQLGSTTTSERQFHSAKRLPPSTPVRLVEIHGRRTYAGELHAAVEHTGRNGYQVGGSWLPAAQYQLDVIGWPDPPNVLRGAPCQPHSLGIPAGVEPLLPGPAADFYGFSALYSVLVGSTTALETEAATTSVAASETATPVTLRDLFRPRYMADVAQPYRTLVLPSQAEPELVRSEAIRKRAKVTVLDGAAATCRWLYSCMSPTTLALVERPSPSAGAAADALYQSRARSDADLSLPDGLAPPGGIEVLAWRSRRNTS
ncbi:hypothetical protein [Streptomyces alboflavus]|uniref:hypothetical protein n=1 Tax=Streptomyces alboflavus TaxID=67267 RepID=UPI0012FEF6AF|nr:hypothetical protein [Streptomyces alboflavus]